MTQIFALVLLLLALAIPAHGQSITLPEGSDEPAIFTWQPPARKAADIISTGTVIAQIGLDTIHSFRSAHKGRAFLAQSCEMGIAIAVAETAKHLITRTRPDGSDRKSFFSEHTALATAAGGSSWRGHGWTLGATMALDVGTGYLRMAAGKHYLSDVIVGAGTGALATWACR
jgi:membrane-associated phospholipid phosphatase